MAEERRFRHTLERGLHQLETLRGREVTGHDLFVLHDTYGFPVELAVEEARRSGFSLPCDWSEEYHAEISAQRARSQAAALLLDEDQPAAAHRAAAGLAGAKSRSLADG